MSRFRQLPSLPRPQGLLLVQTTWPQKDPWGLGCPRPRFSVFSMTYPRRDFTLGPSVFKMAANRAGETRRLSRQCASSLLSASHRLERGETESTTTSLQTFANVTNPPTEPNHPVASSSSYTAIQEHMNLFGFKPSAV